MGGVKLELLGIAVILAGVAFSTNHIAGFYAGAVGLAIAFGGCFWKDGRK